MEIYQLKLLQEKYKIKLLNALFEASALEQPAMLVQDCEYLKTMVVKGQSSLSINKRIAKICNNYRQEDVGKWKTFLECVFSFSQERKNVNNFDMIEMLGLLEEAYQDELCIMSNQLYRDCLNIVLLIEDEDYDSASANIEKLVNASCATEYNSVVLKFLSLATRICRSFFENKKTSDIINSVAFVAVRSDGGHGSFFDMSSVSGFKDDVAKSIEKAKINNGIWAEANPVIRIAQIKIIEVKDV